MDTFLAIASRREVRDYEPRSLPPEVEERILDAGRLAGSSKNRQPWRFEIVPAELLADFVYEPPNLHGAPFVVAMVVARQGADLVRRGSSRHEHAARRLERGRRLLSERDLRRVRRRAPYSGSTTRRRSRSCFRSAIPPSHATPSRARPPSGAPARTAARSRRASAGNNRSVQEILSEIERWQKEGERVVVATVIGSRRSAPRPVGLEPRHLRERQALRLRLRRLRRGRRVRAVARGARDAASRSCSRTGSPTRRRGRSAFPAAARSTSSSSACRDRSGCCGSSASGGRGVVLTVIEGEGLGSKLLVVEGGETHRRRAARAGRARRRADPRRPQPDVRARRADKVFAEVYGPPPRLLRLRRRRHRRGARRSREAARLDDDRRGRARQVRDAPSGSRARTS